MHHFRNTYPTNTNTIGGYLIPDDEDNNTVPLAEINIAALQLTAPTNLSTVSIPYSYRYGFNVQERVNELNSSTYDFGARMYDARVGRWFSVDSYSKLYPSQSNYSFAYNSPILYKDYNGDYIILGGDYSYETLLKVFDDAFLQKISVKVSGGGHMLISLNDNVKLTDLNRQQLATYNLIRSMSLDTKRSYRILANNGNGDISQPDSYYDATVYLSNIQNMQNQYNYGKLDMLYHFFKEQKYKQERLIPMDFLNEQYWEDHEKTIADQKKELGFAWTSSVVQSTDEKYIDFHMTNECDEYYMTVRLTKNEEGTYDYSTFIRKDINVGDVISMFEFTTEGSKEEVDTEKVNAYFEANK